MAAVNKPNSKNSANYLSQLWFKYIPYWPLFIILLVVCIAGAWWKLQKTNPTYESYITILIKEKKKGADESKLIESLNPLLTPESVIENEIEILKSISLMTEVVKNLHLYAPIFEKGRFVLHSAYKTSPVSIMAKYPDSLTYSPNIFFSFDKDNLQVNIEGSKYPLNTWVKTKYGELQFVPNKYYSSSSGNQLLFQLYSPKYFASLLAGGVKIAPTNKASAVIRLQFNDEVPERAENILDNLVKVYNKAALTDKNKLAVNTLEFVENRLNVVSHELDSIESKIQQYRASKGAVDIGTQGQMFLQNVSSTDQKIGDVNAQLEALNQAENYVSSKENTGALAPSTFGVSDVNLSQLLNKLYETELQKEKLRKTTAENNPEIISLNDQISKIKPDIIEQIRNQRKALQSNKNSLQVSSGMYSSMLNAIPQKERELIEISRGLTIKNNLYNFLLQRREETALTAASEVSESRVVDEARSSWAPISPKPNRTYLFAVIIAFVLSFALISAKEVFNRTILFRHEIEASTSLPIIGEIAYEKSKNPLIIDGKNTVIASQFRKLRASLTFLGIDSRRKRILVTSTISGEGKSFITANLGLSLAMTGKKVVLLEFDLSNPALSEKFEIEEDKGLTGYITGDNEPEEIIKRTKANDNLFIVPAGPRPANPSEMLLHSKVEDLLNYLHGMFDYIIIDTAPVGPMTDAYILSSYCDATLYVIRHKYTPKRFVQRIDEENKINQLKNAAIVFNGIRSRGFTKNTYGFGYGYGYEYVYKEKAGRKYS